MAGEEEKKELGFSVEDLYNEFKGIKVEFQFRDEQLKSVEIKALLLIAEKLDKLEKVL